jgi:molybdopterin-containing oxidoreductase family iron-sulfur binding subunit
VLEAAWSGADWRAALARGGVYTSAPAAPEVSLQPELAKLDFSEPALEGSGPFALLAFPSPTLYDGRGAHLPWLQELPDPVTKLTWQSWAEVSPKTASGLGVKRGDVLALETPAGRIEVPALPRGGIRDDVIAVAIGQGHTVGRYASRAGGARGANVMAALPAHVDERGGRVWLSVRAEARRTGSFERPAMGQYSDNQRGRQLAEAVSLAALAGGRAGSHAGGHGAEPAAGHGAAPGGAAGHGGHEIRLPYDPGDASLGHSPYRWSMVIDLDRCTGCSACVAACSLENNVPNVGEEMVARSRQMHWLRIERYVGSGEPEFGTGRGRPESGERLGDTDVRHMPQLCQQCGAAPCEPVCPVFATYHNAEGLNGMVYNRCIGTRYCSNNCPYKVRRFNWFDYAIETWPDPLPLMLNPDVTVRGQGVMEKCTFCIQRIELGRQAAKDAGRLIADGEIETACQRACPTDAIAFGNAKDPDSEVVKRARVHEGRAYHALHVLNTRPGITYLAKVRRGEEGADG